MSLLSPPPVQRGGPLPPDDVDNLLRAFYKAQAPDPWPSLPAPRRIAPLRVARPAKGWPLTRSRLAVAASVALLAVGLLVLTGAFQGRSNHNPSPTFSAPPSAERPKYDGTPAPMPHETEIPAKLKINESLIQEPGGTTIHVDVIDWPTTPK